MLDIKEWEEILKEVESFLFIGRHYIREGGGGVWNKFENFLKEKDFFIPIEDFKETFDKFISPLPPNNEDFIKLKKFLKQCIQNYKKIKNQENKILLSEILNWEFFFEKLKKIFDDEGNIKDDASPELKKIREKKRKIREKLLKKVNQLLENFWEEGLLQDKFFTIRQGRIVFPFKTGIRFDKGIIYDYSNTSQTVFIEPFEIITEQNEISKLEKEEKEIIKKILTQLHNHIKSNLESFKELFRQAVEFDYLRGIKEFYIKYDCTIPEIGGDILLLERAYHPLILKYKGKNKTIPLDIEIKCGEGLLISGPNAGGKTVAMQTVALISQMALKGIPVPAKRAIIPDFENIYWVGEETTQIKEEQSKFTAILEKIKNIINSKERKVLVLIDEILSSTDVEEGSALGFSIMKKLKEKNYIVMANTHFSPLKIMVEKEPKMHNASMEFDEKTHKPTYKLIINSIGTSYAFEIAKKINFPKDVVEDALKSIDNYKSNFETLIKELQEEKLKVKKLKQNLEEKLRYFENYKEEIKEKIKKETLSLLNETKKEIEKLLEEAKKEEKIIKKIEKLKELRKKVIEKKDEAKDEWKKPEKLVIGKFYKIKPFGNVVELIELSKNIAVVKLKDRKFKISRDMLYE